MSGEELAEIHEEVDELESAVDNLIEKAIKRDPTVWHRDHFHENTTSDYDKFMAEVGNHRVLKQEEAEELVRRYLNLRFSRSL